jgi:hypothetical protein
MQDFDSKWLPFHYSFTYYLYFKPMLYFGKEI